MSREEAAAKAAYIEHSQEPNFDAEAAWDDMSGTDDWEQGLWGLTAQAALAAADAHDAANGVHRVTLDDETVERAAKALTAHAVITDGLAVGYGWCAECGEVDPDDDHEARAVLAAAVKEGQ